jgi:hypothetical protein
MKRLQEMLALQEGKKAVDLTPDQNRALEHEIGDLLGFDVEVDHVELEDGVYTAFYSFDDPKDNFKARHKAIRFTGTFSHHSMMDFKRVVKESLITEGKDLGELIDKWMDDNKAYSFEGPRGERNLEKLIKEFGYDSMSSFLQDNSGAIEAIIEWIKDSGVTDWADALDDGSSDEDEDDQDEDR